MEKKFKSNCHHNLLMMIIKCFTFFSFFEDQHFVTWQFVAVAVYDLAVNLILTISFSICFWPSSSSNIHYYDHHHHHHCFWMRRRSNTHTHKQMSKTIDYQSASTSRLRIICFFFLLSNECIVIFHLEKKQQQQQQQD